jgi:uncharacterized protein (DUF924 family)
VGKDAHLNIQVTSGINIQVTSAINYHQAAKFMTKPSQTTMKTDNSEKSNLPNWQHLYDYWFGEIEATGDYIKERLPIWFFCDKAADERISREFAPWLEEMTDSMQTEWKKTPKGFLTLILLFDQVPRNAFRKTLTSFQFDYQARTLACEFLEKGFDKGMDAIELFFVYLTFQHHENLKSQEISVRCIQEQARRASSGHADFFEITKDMAARHYTAIELFGRFPHRNSILGRTSSSAEIEFLQNPKNHF